MFYVACDGCNDVKPMKKRSAPIPQTWREDGDTDPEYTMHLCSDCVVEGRKPETMPRRTNEL